MSDDYERALRETRCMALPEVLYPPDTTTYPTLLAKANGPSTMLPLCINILGRVELSRGLTCAFDNAAG